MNLQFELQSYRGNKKWSCSNRQRPSAALHMTANQKTELPIALMDIGHSAAVQTTVKGGKRWLSLSGLLFPTQQERQAIIEISARGRCVAVWVCVVYVWEHILKNRG